MTEHFTREEAVALAMQAGIKASIGKTIDGKYHPNKNALASSVPVEWIERLIELAVTAKLKEWEAQGAVGVVNVSDGYKGIPNIAVAWMKEVSHGTKLYTHAQAAQPAEPVNAELVKALKKLLEQYDELAEEDNSGWILAGELAKANHAREVLSRAQAAPAVGVPDGWIPVGARMPDSGQTVLALQTWDHSGKQSIIRALWVMAKTVESDEDSEIGEYDEATGTYYDPEGWYECISHWEEFSAVAVTGAKVTHWASLKPVLASAQPQQKEG